MNGRYEASDTGLIRSMRTRSGSLRKPPKILRPSRNKGGYLIVNLLGRVKLVHTLVLEAFVGPRPPGQETRHLDGVSYRNRIENLRWGTKGENTKDMVLHGKLRGVGKLTKIHVLIIRSSNAIHSDLAKLFGVTYGAIYAVRHGKSWTWF